MKRVIAIFVTAILLILCGCGAKEKSQSAREILISLPEYGVENAIVEEAESGYINVNDSVTRANIYFLREISSNGEYEDGKKVWLLAECDELSTILPLEPYFFPIAELYVCDITGDNYDEIILHRNCGGVGGAGSWSGQVYSIENGAIAKIFEWSEDYDFMTGRVIDGYKFTISNSATGYNKTFDMSKYPECASFFDENGKVTDTFGIGGDTCCEFYPSDVDGDGVYEINVEQYAWCSYHAGGLGYYCSTLRYNSETADFDVIDAWFEPMEYIS